MARSTIPPPAGSGVSVLARSTKRKVGRTSSSTVSTGAWPSLRSRMLSSLIPGAFYYLYSAPFDVIPPVGCWAFESVDSVAVAGFEHKLVDWTGWIEWCDRMHETMLGNGDPCWMGRRNMSIVLGQKRGMKWKHIPSQALEFDIAHTPAVFCKQPLD